MELGYGLVTAQRYPGDPRIPTDLYREALELAKACEGAGLDSVFMSEHHFWDDDYMPSLLVTAAAMAGVTTRIKIGTGVLLAPLYDPIRLAEDAATLDLISGGRLILGLGAGWREEEFDRLGASMDALGRRMSETVKVLHAAWGPEPFTFEGKALRYETTNVTPKPSRQIPIWLGGFADDALRRAGRIGDGFIGSSTRGANFADAIARVREGLAKSGRDASAFRFALHYPVYVAADRERGLDEVLPYMHNSRWKYGDMRPTFGRRSDVALPSPPPLDDPTRRAMADSIAVGSPEQIAEAVREFRDVVGTDIHFIARNYFPGMPFEKQLEQVALLGEVKKLL